MKKFSAIILALSMLLCMAACAEQKNSENQPASSDNNQSENAGIITASLHIELDDWPVVDGALACLPYYQKAASLLLDMDEQDAGTYILANNTPASFNEIATGSADLIFCLHGSDEQESYADECGTTLSYTPFALDAFVFYVNKNNPVDSLTMDQLKAIYAGEITNWKEVGGNDEEIIAYQRNEGSGSQTGLYQYVISQDEVMDPPTERRIATMGEIIDAVASYEDSSSAIGYSYLYFVTNQHFDEQIKLLKINGIAPTNENIQSYDYPMVTEYCCVTSNKSAAVVQSIVDWCVSDEGQALAKQLSYVPVR